MVFCHSHTLTLPIFFPSPLSAPPSLLPECNRSSSKQTTNIDMATCGPLAVCLYTIPPSLPCQLAQSKEVYFDGTLQREVDSSHSGLASMARGNLHDWRPAGAFFTVCLEEHRLWTSSIVHRQELLLAGMANKCLVQP